MPSKKNTILALILVAAGIGASLYWEDLGGGWTRNVHHYPPELERVFVLSVDTDVTAPPAPAPKSRPDQPKPPRQEPPADGSGQPGPAGEIRITDLQLQPVTGNQTRPVDNSDEDKLVVLRVYPDGRLRWGSFTAGSYEIIGDMCKNAAMIDGFTLIIAPDHKTPWKYVYWAMQVAQENGVYNVGIGVTPTWDEERNLLAQLKTPLPETEYVEDPNVPELELIIDEDKTGNVEYTLLTEAGTGLSALYKAVGDQNSEYAEFIDGNYTRDVSKNPWVLVAPPDVRSGAVCRTLDVIRACAVYTVRFGGEFPARPK